MTLLVLQARARCAVYDSRPERCRRYPEGADELRPPECTYTFDATGARVGECACGVGACCAVTRLGGEPEGAAFPPPLGRPCRHLVFDPTA